MDFVNHVSIIVISQCSAQFFVVHGWFVLPSAPLLGHLLRIVQFELAILADPHDKVPTASVGQQLQQELPQLDLTVITWQTRHYISNFYHSTASK